MRKINNSKSKLLFSSSATLLLGLFLTNPQLVKADKATTKDSQTQTEEVVNNTNNSVSTTETTTNSATSPTQGDNDNAPDDDIVDGSYQGIDLYYNTTSNEITITGGTRTASVGTSFSNLVLHKNDNNYSLKLAKKINIVGRVNLGTDGAKGLFSGFENVEEVTGLDKLDTSKCTSFNAMFSFCPNLVNADVSGMDASLVKDAYQMFFSCPRLHSIDLSSWKAPKLVDVRQMFCWDESLVSVKFISHTAGTLSYLSDLFYGCSSLTAVDLSKVVLNNNPLTNPTQTLLRAFQDCSSLRELDLSSLDMRNIESPDMLDGLAKLTVLKLGKKTRLDSDCGLVNPGTWLNVGPGHTINNPEGKKRWSSKELIANYSSSASSSMDFVEDTYVLFGEPVTLQYLDENGSKIHEDSTSCGIMGEEGVITAEKIPGYFLKEGQPSYNITYTDKAQTFKLVYTTTPPTGANVTVHYRDEAGKAIADDVVLSGYLESEYSSEEKTFPDYVLKDKPANAKGYFSTTPQEVTYVYTKKTVSNVTVHYWDENGQSIADDEVLSGKLDSSYEAKSKDIPNYVLVKTPDNAKGHFSNEPQEVTYIYTKVDGGNITVHFRDKAGKTLVPDQVLTGKLDDSYETKAEEIKDYEVAEQPNNATGKFTHEPQEVTYIYTKVDGGNITVHFRDEAGKTLAPDQVLTGKLDDPYEATPKDITDYELVKTPDNVKGQFSNDPQEVTFVYTKKAGADVIVHYQDEAGNTIAADETLSGKLDASYTAKPKDITDYELVKTPMNATGTFGHKTHDVTFVYTKKTVSNVTVHYQDETGKSIADDKILSGKLGDKYTAEPKDITDYELVDQPTNATGTFGHDAQEVTFVYTKTRVNPIPTPSPTPSKGSDTPIAGADVTIYHQNEAGKTLAPKETLKGNLGEGYVSMYKEIAGYILKVRPANATGFFDSVPQSVTYVYSKVKSVGNASIAGKPKKKAKHKNKRKRSTLKTKNKRTHKQSSFKRKK